MAIDTARVEGWGMVVAEVRGQKVVPDAGRCALKLFPKEIPPQLRLTEVPADALTAVDAATTPGSWVEIRANPQAETPAELLLEITGPRKELT